MFRHLPDRLELNMTDKMKTSSFFKNVLVTGLVAGTLDILAAVYLLADGKWERVFRFIAKGAVGVKAFTGGFEMVALGAFFHYLIALSFTLGYFLVYGKVKVLHKNWIASGVFFGVFVWSYMQFVVLPLTHNPPGELTFEVWKGVLIHIFAIGLPIAWGAKRWRD